MPGSANFIGEFYILNGLFQAKIVFAFVAISGVAMSAYYALRLYQRTMHNRKPDGLASREIGSRDGVILAPLVLCILGLALYPQLILQRTAPTVDQSVATLTGGEAPEAQLARQSPPRRANRRRANRPGESRHLNASGAADELPRTPHRLRRALAGDRPHGRASSSSCWPASSGR